MTTSTMFTGLAERETIRGWYEKFRERLGAGVEDRLVPTSFGQTHALVTGPEGAPPLVALHGALASSAHLLGELGPLRKARRIFAIDVVGQSVMSEDRRVPVEDDSYGRWVGDVTTALGLNTFDLLGVSWGGFVATRAAVTAPERVRRLVLIVPAGLVSGSAWAGFRDLGWPMLKYRMFPSPSRLQEVLSALFSTQDPEWGAYLGEALRAYRLDMRIPPLAKPDEVRAVTCPTLVFGAEHDVSFPGEKLLACAQELFPQVEVELLAGSKHSPPFTDAFRAQFNARIETFLAGESRSTRQDAGQAPRLQSE